MLSAWLKRRKERRLWAQRRKVTKCVTHIGRGSVRLECGHIVPTLGVGDENVPPIGSIGREVACPACAANRGVAL